MTQTTTRKPRLMAREKLPQATTPISKASCRLDDLQALLTRDGGATIAEMAEATGWQQHSVRGAMAGALKKRGLVISSEKTDGVRHYHGKVGA